MMLHKKDLKLIEDALYLYCSNGHIDRYQEAMDLKIAIDKHLEGTTDDDIWYLEQN